MSNLEFPKIDTRSLDEMLKDVDLKKAKENNPDLEFPKIDTRSFDEMLKDVDLKKAKENNLDLEFPSLQETIYQYNNDSNCSDSIGRRR